MRLVPLFAQCIGALDECDIPRTLPWYFGVAIASVWLAAVIGAFLLIRRRFTARRADRRRAGMREVPERSTGTTIEPW